MSREDTGCFILHFSRISTDFIVNKLSAIKGDVIARDHGYKSYLLELILKQRKWFKLDIF
jgi:hypothetical protein